MTAFSCARGTRLQFTVSWRALLTLLLLFLCASAFATAEDTEPYPVEQFYPMLEPPALALVTQADEILRGGDYARAEQLYEQALESLSPRSNYRARALLMLKVAQLVQVQGNYSQAQYFYERACRTTEAAYGADHQVNLSCNLWTAEILIKLDKHSEAAALLKNVLRRSRRMLGDKDVQTINIRVDLSRQQALSGDSANAVANARAALAAWRSAHKELSQKAGELHTNLAQIFVLEKNFVAAETEANHAIENFQGNPSAAHALSLWILGNALYDQHSDPEAVMAYRRLLAMARTLGDTQKIVQAHCGLGQALLSLDDEAQAREHVQAALALLDPKAQTGQRFACMLMLAKLQLRGEEHQAEESLRWVIDFPETQPDIVTEQIEAALELSELLLKKDRADEALAVLQYTAARARAQLAKPNALTAKVLDALGEKAWERQEDALARASWQEAVDIYRQVLPADDVLLGRTLLRLGKVQHSLGEKSAATAAAEAALAIYAQDPVGNAFEIASAHLMLGEDAASLREAHAHYRKAWRALTPGQCPDDLVTVGIAWAHAQFQLGKLTEARAVLEDTLTRDQTCFYPNTDTVIATLLLARTWQVLGNLQQATMVFDQVRARCEQPPDDETVADACRVLQRDLQTGQCAPCERYARKAWSSRAVLEPF